MLKLKSYSPEMTRNLGEAIGKKIPPGTTLALSGDLGAGKTVFAQGLALGLGIKSRVKSPTFIIMENYQEGRLPFCHIDAYRLNEDELWRTGFEECFDGQNVVLIEWAENISALLAGDAIRIEFIRTFQGEEEMREINIRVDEGEKKWLEEAVCDAHLGA